MRTTALASLAWLAACAAPAAEPLRYPTLPPASVPAPSANIDAFDPSPSLAALSLACDEAELSVPNGLDDDCDGSVDALPADQPLLVALAFPRALASGLALAVRSESIEQPLIASDCPPQRSVCTVYLETKNLARGRHTVLARRTDPSGTSETSALVVSIQSRGKVTTYLATLAAGASEQALGALALP